MSQNVEALVLGQCPACGATISSKRLLAKYDPPSGWPVIYAECPGCGDVRRPA